MAPQAVGSAAQEDQRDLVATREIHDGIRDIGALKDARFDVEISCEVQVLFYPA